MKKWSVIVALGLAATGCAWGMEKNRSITYSSTEISDLYSLRINSWSDDDELSPCYEVPENFDVNEAQMKSIAMRAEAFFRNHSRDEAKSCREIHAIFKYGYNRYLQLSSLVIGPRTPVYKYVIENIQRDGLDSFGKKPKSTILLEIMVQLEMALDAYDIPRLSSPKIVELTQEVDALITSFHGKATFNANELNNLITKDGHLCSVAAQCNNDPAVVDAYKTLFTYSLKRVLASGAPDENSIVTSTDSKGNVIPIYRHVASEAATPETLEQFKDTENRATKYLGTVVRLKSALKNYKKAVQNYKKSQTNRPLNSPHSSTTSTHANHTHANQQSGDPSLNDIIGADKPRYDEALKEKRHKTVSLYYAVTNELLPDHSIYKTLLNQETIRNLKPESDLPADLLEKLGKIWQKTTKLKGESDSARDLSAKAAGQIERMELEQKAAGLLDAYNNLKIDILRICEQWSEGADISSEEFKDQIKNINDSIAKAKNSSAVQFAALQQANDNIRAAMDDLENYNPPTQAHTLLLDHIKFLKQVSDLYGKATNAPEWIKNSGNGNATALATSLSIMRDRLEIIECQRLIGTAFETILKETQEWLSKGEEAQKIINKVIPNIKALMDNPPEPTTPTTPLSRSSFITKKSVLIFGTVAFFTAAVGIWKWHSNKNSEPAGNATHAETGA